MKTTLLRGYWESAHQWLSENEKGVLETLYGPASESSLERWEHYFGIDMPTELKELYQICDGQRSYGILSSLFYGQGFMCVEESLLEYIGTHRDHVDFCYHEWTDIDIEISREADAPSKWIPITDARDTNGICVDIGPSDAGTYGQVIYYELDLSMARKLEDSVTDMIKTFSEDLKANRYETSDDEPAFLAFKNSGDYIVPA